MLNFQSVLAVSASNADILWEKLQQRSRVTKFLMRLNESYETTRRHILMLKPITCIEDVFDMVTQDERQKNVKPSSCADSVVFQTSAPSLDTSAPSIDNSSEHAYAAL